MNFDTSTTMATHIGNRLALLPLPLVLLPGGIQRIKIFESKHLALIKEAAKGNGFVLSLFKPDLPHKSSLWGVQVKVIDFEFDDHFLVVDIQAEDLVCLTEISQSAEGVLFANVAPKTHWESRQITPDMKILVKQLRAIFHKHPNLKRLYRKTYFNDPNWVCARFIEVLPLSLNEKEKCILEYRLDQIEAFLNTIISGPTIKS